jgi:hypothetical protein
MYEVIFIEVAPEAIAKTLVVKIVKGDGFPEGRYEVHHAGRLFASWPDEISARVQLLAFEFKGFRVIWE